MPSPKPCSLFNLCATVLCMNQQVIDKFKNRLPKTTWLLLSAAALLALIVIVPFLTKPWRQGSNVLSATVTSQINDFEPYYFATDIPGGFTLNEKTVTYNKGVLFFQLENSTRGQIISVTEQLLPEAVANNAYSKAEVVNGADGKAIISYEGTRTMGALFSAKQHNTQTLVLITTSNPIAKETVGDMLRALRPMNEIKR